MGTTSIEASPTAAGSCQIGGRPNRGARILGRRQIDGQQRPALRIDVWKSHQRGGAQRTRIDSGRADQFDGVVCSAAQVTEAEHRERTSAIVGIAHRPNKCRDRLLWLLPAFVPTLAAAFRRTAKLLSSRVCTNAFEAAGVSLAIALSASRRTAVSGSLAATSSGRTWS